MNAPARLVRLIEDGRTTRIRWCSSTYGRSVDTIHLERMPDTGRERVWVFDVLPTRLRPGGQITGPDGTVLWKARQP